MVRNLNKSETSLLIPIPTQTVKTPFGVPFKNKYTKFKNPFNFSNVGCKISFKLFLKRLLTFYSIAK